MSGAAGCHENALADVLLILEILRHTLLSKQNSKHGSWLGEAVERVGEGGRNKPTFYCVSFQTKKLNLKF